MEIIKTSIKEVVILEPRVFGDHRGYFMELFSERWFTENVYNTHFVQDNESKSTYGVLRGLHFQRPPHAQAKLMRVVEGCILDVAVDIRKNSPTFGQHVAMELSSNNKRQMFIPRGFAHGFAVLSPKAIITYKCDNYYHPQSEDSILWNDPQLNINWLLPEDKIILSNKDKEGKLLTEIEPISDDY